MIEATKAYRVGDRTFGTLAEAQAHELSQLFTDGDFGSAPVVGRVANKIVEHKAKILDILKTTPRSHVKARKINRKTTPKVLVESGKAA